MARAALDGHRHRPGMSTTCWWPSLPRPAWGARLHAERGRHRADVRTGRIGQDPTVRSIVRSTSSSTTGGTVNKHADSQTVRGTRLRFPVYARVALHRGRIDRRCEHLTIKFGGNAGHSRYSEKSIRSSCSAGAPRGQRPRVAAADAAAGDRLVPHMRARRIRRGRHRAIGRSIAA